jgi:hypothetical protein
MEFGRLGIHRDGLLFCLYYFSIKCINDSGYSLLERRVTDVSSNIYYLPPRKPLVPPIRTQTVQTVQVRLPDKRPATEPIRPKLGSKKEPAEEFKALFK